MGLTILESREEPRKRKRESDGEKARVNLEVKSEKKGMGN